MVAAVEGHEMAGACGQQVGRASGSKAGEDRQAERPAHHERGIDDSRGQAGFSWRNVAHGGKQHRVEGDAARQSEQDHVREHIDDKVPIDRCSREEHESDGGQQQPGSEWGLDAEPHDEPGRKAERANRHAEAGWQEGEADQQRAVPEHQLEVESREEEPAEQSRGHRTPTTLAVATLRRRKMPSGMSGARTRPSIKKKITNSTAAALSRPIVWPDATPHRCRSRSHRQRA